MNYYTLSTMHKDGCVHTERHMTMTGGTVSWNRLGGWLKYCMMRQGFGGCAPQTHHRRVTCITTGSFFSYGLLTERSLSELALRYVCYRDSKATLIK